MKNGASTAHLLLTCALVSAPTFACSGSGASQGDGDGDASGGAPDGSGGDGPGGGSTGGAASGGAAAGGGTSTGGESASGGGSSTGGSANGGSSSGGSGTLPDDEHCSPGELVPSFALNGGYIITCSGWDEENAELNLGEGVWAGSIELTTPMTAGEPFAISDAYVDYATGIIEYYGATEECGAGLQLLSSQEGAGRFLICHDTTPDANYTHVIQVWRDVVGSQGDMTFCPDVTCD